MPTARIYQYGDTFKVVYLKFKNVEKKFNFDGNDTTNEEKLSNNISRARGRILELALCNDWEYFVTLTLDKTKQDRYSLDTYVRDLGNWIGNYNKKFNTKLKYLLIPEQHKDGAWHMHGLLNGVSRSSLEVNEHGYYSLSYYSERFGFISLSRIQDKIKVARYITKYVSKGLSARSCECGKHLFYASRGLTGRNLAGEFPCTKIPDGVGFENEYCAIEWADNDEALASLLDRVER